MIDEQQIQEAIAYCNGKIDPTRNDAILLAACYIIQDHFRSTPQLIDAGQSFAPPPVEQAESYADRTNDSTTVGDFGDSSFLQAVHGMDEATAWRVMDDLMSTLEMVNHRIYDSVMRELK